MRLGYLFFLSRLTGPAIVGLAAIAGIACAWGHWLGDKPEAVLLGLVFFPLAAACIVGISTHSPFGETERTAGFPMCRLRFSHLAGLLAIGSVVLAVASLGWAVEDAGRIFVRNLLGFTGLVFLAAWLIGGRLSWIVPLVFGMAGYLTGPPKEDGVSHKAAWTWPVQPFTDEWATGAALVLVLTGFVVVVRFGARDGGD